MLHKLPMLSTHIDPFTAFCNDLQIEGCEVHLYKGPNTFGGILTQSNALLFNWWDTENVYFLAGVRPGLTKRAADSDVLKRGMFTLDFDIRKELEKLDGLTQHFKHPEDPAEMDYLVKKTAEAIVQKLGEHETWKNFRYVVLSGNGMHVHYFGDPCTVIKEEWAAGMKDIFDEINKIIVAIPCDTGCGNPGRIMRMPGSWNLKDPAHKKPVEIDIWMPGATLPPMQFVQERGKLAIQHMTEQREAEQKAFTMSHPEGGSTVIDLINHIPIEQVVKLLLQCDPVIKKDGGMRFCDDKGVERGFFRHREHNLIVHEGTSLFSPPKNVGYNCLGLVKEVLGIETPAAVAWFTERNSVVRDAEKKAREAWAAAHEATDLFDYEQKHSQPPSVL